jgi:quercetin dioxygenase-like cupin family protein
VTLQEGDMLVIPANVEHEAWSIVDTVVWDFFTEVREDWKLGQNQYLSGDR